MINVLAFITTKPGHRDAVLAAFHENMPLVHAEDGCIEYAPAIDWLAAPDGSPCFGPDSFVVIEKWSSPETLAAHAASLHMAAYGARVREMIVSRAIHVLAPA